MTSTDPEGRSRRIFAVNAHRGRTEAILREPYDLGFLSRYSSAQDREIAERGYRTGFAQIQPSIVTIVGRPE